VTIRRIRIVLVPVAKRTRNKESLTEKGKYTLLIILKEHKEHTHG
jgi:hypothetical protein